MTPALFLELAAHAADVAAIDGDATSIVSVAMGELADGSGRHFAIVQTTDANELDQTFRVTSPAPKYAPAWATVHRGWTIEVRQCDDWLMLTNDDDCSCGDDFDPACALHGTLEVER
jgi:hypothetical protein